MFNTSNKNYKSFRILSAKCPKCGDTLSQNKNHLLCSNNLLGTCNFKIDRNINGKKIDLEAFADFLDKTSGITEVYNKINLERDKRVKEDEQYRKECIESLSKKDSFYKGSRYLNGARCPKCSSYMLYRNEDTVKCSRCNDFTLNTTFKGANFSDYDIARLLDRCLSSKEYKFTDENGRKFNAKAFLALNEELRPTSNYKIFDKNNLSETELRCIHIYTDDFNYISLKKFLEK